MNKKKKEEFTEICLRDKRAKILIIQGPAGCGKNSLIDCFGEQYNYQVHRYKDTGASMQLADTYGEAEMIDEKHMYPDDLENLLSFIANLKKKAAMPGGSGGQPKRIQASSFALKTSSFASAKSSSTPFKSSSGQQQ